MSNLKALPFFSSVSHQDILDHLPTGVIQIDSRGIIVYTNNVLLQWIGYAETELIGRPLQEFFPAFTLRDCEDEKSPIERHYEINTIDNGSLYVKTLIQSYKKQGQTAHLLLIRKLGKKTKWRKIFEKFKQNHAHLLPDDAYMTLDITGAFRDVNEKCSVLTGYTGSELLQKMSMTCYNQIIGMKQIISMNAFKQGLHLQLLFPSGIKRDIPCGYRLCFSPCLP
ncbi:PAS domain S-box protein [Brevibacillus laterosporus]